MDFQQTVDGLTQEMVARLQSAIELGKWPDGRVLTQAQRDSAMQAVILWQAKYADQTQHLTVAKGGELNHLSKAELKRQFNETPIARFKPE
ncbi:YeaC family protein [Ferrimonas pelagia]|uniref:DUF1315 family protein n=1 Tax=Ferrimonas pelagia TaxID=1177826 RepID=A0ABP9FJF5_9GAMM